MPPVWTDESFSAGTSCFDRGDMVTMSGALVQTDFDSTCCS